MSHINDTFFPLWKDHLSKIVNLAIKPGQVEEIFSTAIELMLSVSKLNMGLGFSIVDEDLRLVAWHNVDEKVISKIQKINISNLFSTKYDYPTVLTFKYPIAFQASLTVILGQDVENYVIVPITIGSCTYGLIVLVDLEEGNITSELEDLMLLSGVAAGVALHEINAAESLNLPARVFLLVNLIHFVAKYLARSNRIHEILRFLAELIYRGLHLKSCVLVFCMRSLCFVFEVICGKTCGHEITLDEGADLADYSGIREYLSKSISFQGDLVTINMPPADLVLLDVQMRRLLSKKELDLIRSIAAELYFLSNWLDPEKIELPNENRYEKFMPRTRRFNFISDKDILSNTLVREVGALVNAEKSLLIIKEKNTKKCSILGSSGFDRQSASFLEQVLEQKYCFGNRPLNMIRFWGDPRLPLGFRGLLDRHKYAPILIIPLEHFDLFEGVLVLINKKEDKNPYFKIEDERILENLSGHFALTIGNCLMRTETEKRMVELVTINTVARTIYSRLNMSEFLPILVNIVAKALRARKCWVAMLDDSRQFFSTKAAWGLQAVDNNHTVLKDHEGIAGLALQTGKPFLTTKIEGDERLSVLDRKRYKKGSYLAVPIKFQGNIKGIIHVADKIMESNFTKDDLDWLINLTGHIAVGIENAELYENIKAISDGIINGLNKIIELKDTYTSGHSERVAVFSLLIGEKMGLSPNELNILRYGSWLHDIGKIGVPRAILNKPGRLTLEEKGIISKHPKMGWDILHTIKPLKDILPLVLHHHEWYDGSGYPDGLKGEEIPIGARVMHVADAIDAMTSNRAYRKAMDLQMVLNQLRLFSGSQFDPEVVRIVLDTMLFEFFQKKGYNG